MIPSGFPGRNTRKMKIACRGRDAPFLRSEERRKGAVKILTNEDAKEEILRYDQLGILLLDPEMKWHVGRPELLPQEEIDFLPEGGLPECVRENPGDFSFLFYKDGGRNLHDIFDDASGISPEVMLHVVRSVLKTLDVMNSAGVYHCDVKGGNVVTNSTSTDGVVRLIDFGLSTKFPVTKETDTFFFTGKCPYFVWPPETWYLGGCVGGNDEAGRRRFIDEKLKDSKFYIGGDFPPLLDPNFEETMERTKDVLLKEGKEDREKMILLKTDSYSLGAMIAHLLPEKSAASSMVSRELRKFAMTLLTWDWKLRPTIHEAMVLLDSIIPS